MAFSIKDVKLIVLPSYSDNNGNLTVMEGLKDIPFEISRLFVIRADVNSIRGQHAHKTCSQFLTCPYGSVEVHCDDGQDTIKYLLNKPNLGLLIPESIWAEQTYLKPDSILNVLCNRPYEVEDYIRDYQQFKNFRNEKSKQF